MKLTKKELELLIACLAKEKADLRKAKSKNEKLYGDLELLQIKLYDNLKK